MQAVYTADSGVDLYLDNILKGDDHEAQDGTWEVAGSIIAVGRYFADDHDRALKYGDFTIDYLTIWDWPLDEAERNLL